MSALIFDTETTGGEPPLLIEAAWIKFEGDEGLDLRPSERFDQRYNPGQPSTFGALATHHILDIELRDCPPPSEFSLPEDVNYLVGHNVDYDWAVIGKPRVRLICTLALARSLFPTLDSHSLGALAYYLLGAEARPLLKDAHTAAADVEVTRHVLRHLVGYLRAQGMPATWEALYEASEQARVPKVIAFGKHKGTAITELPGDYVGWLLRQPDLDPYLKQALESRQ